MTQIALKQIEEIAKSLQRVLDGKAGLAIAAGDNARFQVWSGDLFADDPESSVVIIVRAIPRPFFKQYQAATPERVHIVTTPPEPSPTLRLMA